MATNPEPAGPEPAGPTDEAFADGEGPDSIDLSVGDDEHEPAPEPTPEDRVAAAEDRALRLQAEMQNVLNRTRREVADQRKYGSLALARDLLSAIDNMDRALEAARAAASGDGDDPLGLVAGMTMVRQQIVDTLAQHGCQPIACDPGVEFDPALHEAILQQPSDEHPAGAIVAAAQPGFVLHDRVVRAAQVIVSSGPAA
ncbi:MAG: nucleotide exchange factor GrpE [Planctomycetota bacterium]